MKFKSTIFCNHANECPSGVCDCPSDCACRETMCKPTVDNDVIDEIYKSLKIIADVLVTKSNTGEIDEYDMVVYDELHKLGLVGISEETGLIGRC